MSLIRKAQKFIRPIVERWVGRDKQQDIIDELKTMNNHLAKLAGCVKKKHHGHGDQASLSTKHWND